MISNLEELTIDFLKENNQRLYYFGLGFIQLKINNTFRIHFYHPELEILVDQPHNHRYNFESLILKGEITNAIYKKTNGDKFYLQEDSCTSGYIPKNKPQNVNFKLISKITYKEGESYFMNHNVFHTVSAKNCITILKRGSYKKELAEISYLKQEEKICPFSIKKSDSFLWDIIKSMLI